MPYHGVVYVGNRKVWQGPRREDRETASEDAAKKRDLYQGTNKRTGVIQAKRSKWSNVK